MRIINIHDKFFQETFTRQEIAGSFLTHYLPRSLLRQVDMRTLTIVKDSFIDKELREHFSDILYTVQFRGTELHIYLLFEHKSYREPLVALQILRYKVKIWEQYVKKHPKAAKIPPVFPMLLYHGRNKWSVPRNFQAIVKQSGDGLLKKYIPEFSYRLCDISHLPDDKIRGDVLGKMVLLVAKYVFRPDLREKLPEILSLLHAVADRRTALEILEVLLRYVVRATEKFDEGDIIEIMEQTSMGDDIMQTFIDKYINQGIGQGIQQGEARILLRQMEARFGKLPPWIMEKIRHADTESIESWSLRLFSANIPEDVLNAND